MVIEQHKMLNEQMQMRVQELEATMRDMEVEISNTKAFYEEMIQGLQE